MSETEQTSKDNAQAENIRPENTDTVNTLPQQQIILGEAEYGQAIDAVIEAAQESVLIFDQDLRTGAYTSVRRHLLIQAFFSRNAEAQLTMILQNATFFVQDCPRLFGLLKLYGHRMQVYETNEEAKHIKDNFVIADGKAFVRRIHIDQSRFKYAMDDPATSRQLADRFEELLQVAETQVSTTLLGL